MSQIKQVAAIQMDVKLSDPNQNVGLMLAHAEDLAEQGILLAAFPECALSGYCFDTEDEALENAFQRDDRLLNETADAAMQLGIHLVFGFLERRGDKVFNTAALFCADGIRRYYHKTHLPMLGVDRFTVPGGDPYCIHEVDGLRIGMNICYDCSFPEPSRVLALRGADLIILPTNWPPGAVGTADYIPNARALENNVYFMAINRIGHERGFDFIGKSKICHPDGHDLAYANHDREAVLIADIDSQVARNKHLVRVPGKHEIHRFDDRRPELYGDVSSE